MSEEERNTVHGFSITKLCKCGNYYIWDDPRFPCQHTCSKCGSYTFWSNPQTPYSQIPSFCDTTEGIETLEE